MGRRRLVVGDFPLPTRLFAHSERLATGQQSVEINMPGEDAVLLQEALVQDSQVGITGQDGNCYNGVDRMGAGLLRNRQQNRCAMAVEPARAGGLPRAGALEALRKEAKHDVGAGATWGEGGFGERWCKGSEGAEHAEMRKA